jgi:hypothetical protein
MLKRNNTKILVCCHEQENFIWNDGIYMPIHVGAALSPIKLDMQRDDEGENISKKNKNYCELTGLYWAWKNLHDVDYVGLCHYRRYFDGNRHLFKINQYIIDTATFKKTQPRMPDFGRLLSKYDVIVTKPVIAPYNLKVHYSTAHVFTDLDALKATIESFFPDYSEAYEKVMNGNKMSGYNMFVAKRDFLDNYCSWLFKILSELEKKIDISSYNPYIARVYGFLGERLLSVYIEKHKLKVKYFPILYINDSYKNSSWISCFLYYIRNMVSYYLIESPQKVKSIIRRTKK